jgi:SH2 domain-containing protein 4A
LFLGQISRQDAEKLLENQKIGSFLVRLSEKIWGYAISYKGQERSKHFLVDASEGRYQFFGTNQLTHNNLEDLVKFHMVRSFALCVSFDVPCASFQSKPISLLGQEILRHPVGQSSNPPDYRHLFSSANNLESSYL